MIKKMDSNLSQFTYDLTRRYLDDLGHADCNGLFQDFIAEAEKGIIKAALEHNDGNQSNTAKQLGITRTTLRSRIDRYEI